MPRYARKGTTMTTVAVARRRPRYVLRDSDIEEEPLASPSMQRKAKTKKTSTKEHQPQHQSKLPPPRNGRGPAIPTSINLNAALLYRLCDHDTTKRS